MEWYKEGDYIDDFEKGMEEYYRAEHFKTNKTMKGKILEIDGTGSWPGQHGEMFTYLVRIQGDDEIYTGEANAKSERADGLPYKIGDEVEFEHEPASNPNYKDKLKIRKEGSENYGGKAKGSNRSFALSYAKDLAIAHMGRGLNSDTESIIKQADAFVKWLDS